MTLPTPAIWHGTPDERSALVRAMVRHFKCDCVYDDEGQMVNPCAGHRWLGTDQRALDGLVFAARIRHRLYAEEFGGMDRREDA